MKLYRLITMFFLILMTFTQISAFETVSGEVEFDIRLYDRRIYYTTDAAGNNDPIYVQVTITNNSPLPYRFKLADDRSFSIDVDARSMSNRQLPQTDLLIRKRTRTSQVFFREITIESRESYSFIENLRDYIRFDNPGSFRVRAVVFPELIRGTGSAPIKPLESNYLNLNLRPAVITGRDGIPIAMDTATGAALVKQPLPPDEVIAYMITARQESQWERFFLYLDPEAMLLRDGYQSRKFTALNETERQKMVGEYIENLKKATVDGDIVVIPTSFEILRTEHNNYEATVTVRQKFRHHSFTQIRLYIYTLDRRDNYWIIVDYSVQDMGTEPNS